jgi:predicted helicase
MTQTTFAAVKRLYMTATPRIYGDMREGQGRAETVTSPLLDGRREAMYGQRTVRLDVLRSCKTSGCSSDYKVIVLSVEESPREPRLQNLLKDENNQLKVDDAAKIVGCWKALSKRGLAEELVGDDAPDAARCCVLPSDRAAEGGEGPQVSSKQIADMFEAVVEAYQETEPEEEKARARLRCEAEHVDGSMNASQKEAKTRLAQGRDARQHLPHL